MRTYKFLAKGAKGPFSGRAWPENAWIATTLPLVVGKHGVHVCRGPELAYWLHDELWEVEVAGDVLEGKDCLVAARARLVRRIEGWNAAGALRFAEACIQHASEASLAPAILEDARLAAVHGYPAVAAFSAALAVGSFHDERVWQSTWLEHEFLS